MTEQEVLARDYFLKGCNCAQAVFAAFCEQTGLDEQTALKLSSSFGGGMARLREVCGAVSGAFMAAGLICGFAGDEPSEVKHAHYARLQALAAEFKEKHGSLLCRELLSLHVDGKFAADVRAQEHPCTLFVMDAAALLMQSTQGEA